MSFEIIGDILWKYNSENNEHDVVIPEGVRIIAAGAFMRAMNLVSVTFPSSLETIREKAFAACGQLQRVDLPAGVTSVENGAFLNCKSLKTVYFPQSLTEIGLAAFGGTEWLSGYYDDFVIVNGMLLRYVGTSITVTVPACVTKICDGAFSNRKFIKSITVPKSATYIGRKCFFMCHSLEEINLPDSLTYIGEEAFEGCVNLLKVDIPNGVRTIRTNCFGICKSLVSVSLPDSVDEIDERAFYGCVSLKKITIPSKVSVIRGLCFMSCRSLESILIPDSVLCIEREAFSNCLSLKSVTMSRNITDLHEKAFYCSKEINTLHFGEFTIRSNSLDMRKFRPNLIREMLNTKNYTMRMDHSVKYSIVTRLYLENSQPEARAYIKKNYSNIMRCLIDVNDYESIKKLLDSGIFPTKRCTEKMLEYAVAHTQNSGDPQIQVCLANFKAEKYPEADLFHDLTL